MRLVQTGNVGVAEYLDKPNNKKWISEDTFDRLHCEEVLPGDILISRLPEPAGRACIVPLLGTKMITAVDCTIVRTAPDMSNKFLVQYLSSQAYFDDVNTCLAGGTRQRISRGNLANFNVPIPVKKSEQDAIGMFFGYLDNLITLHQRQPFLQSPPDISLIVQLTPPFYTFSWEQRKLGDIASDMVAGGDIDKDLILAEGQYPVIANALTGDGIVGYYDKEYRVNAPAVTVTGRGDVGHAKARLVNFTPVVRLLSVKSEHDVFFLENAINTLKIVIESTGVPQLTVPQLAKYEVAFPRQLDEEEHIGAFFKQLDHLITLHQRQTIVYAVIRSIRKVILAERQYFAPPMVRKSP